MEYGLRIATLESAFTSPSEFCDSTLWELCSEASLSALYFGSEFCQDLLPSIEDAAAFCIHCLDRGLEPVLLTPLVTYRGLARLTRLLSGLQGLACFPTVVFNDWGVFELLSQAYSTLPLRMGRLMNRGLRDPRLEMPALGPDGENTNRGMAIRKLAAARGVVAVETDADLEPGYLGAGTEGLQRTLHVPFTFIASGRNCLEKAAATPEGRGIFTQGLSSGCAGPCRGISRRELRQDTQKEMWRAGNTVFFKAPQEWIARHITLADRVVFHAQPMP